jgi:hypothetical protein
VFIADRQWKRNLECLEFNECFEFITGGVQGHDRDANESTDTEDEFEAMDERSQAEVRAMARRWLQGRKGALGLLDAAYNRYTFDDRGGVPRWFQEDEARHMRPAAVVSREEVEAEREALRAIDARPLKKVRCDAIGTMCGWSGDANIFFLQVSRCHGSESLDDLVVGLFRFL